MPPDLDALLAGAARFTPTAVVRARRLDHPLSWRDSRGTTLRAAAGDWELTDPDGARWTISPEAFARSYHRLPDGRFAKHETVEAVRLRRAVEVPTREGPVTAQPGDWLLRDAEGAVWPVPDALFRARYRPVEP